ncbi:unnamed protein product [Aphanomyces euteiches]|nr:hypothetical protein AeRB84_005038 [Aphanomyces euteiches]
MTTNLFTPIQVGSLQLTNRIFMAPLTRTRANLEHVPSDLAKEYYAQRASAGLIIAEATAIAPNTSAFIMEPGIYTQEQLTVWKDITDAVHAKGGKIFSQLECRCTVSDCHDGETYTLQGKKPFTVPHELTVNEIATIVDQFATAAKNAIQVAGFDGVEIHGANSYLIEQFLFAGSNTRTDQYGGSLENRSRFLTELLQAVTNAIGSDKVGISFSPLNTHNSMHDPERLVLSEHVAKIAQTFNLAYVHIIRRELLGNAQGDIVPIFRKHFHNTLISNAGFTKDEANEAIASGLVDAVAFGTLFIANPDLPERFAKNAPLATADPSTFYVGGAKGYTDYPALS